MIVTPENIIYNELIGLRVKVIGSSDQSQQSLSGTVVDETANMLVISTQGSARKMIPKAISRFSFSIPEEVIVEGREIAMSPEERLKRLQRRR
ncbi:MAG: ribonuclease P protein subunit [Candidatus Methanosuratus sp.]|nr:ribonuclease P protein subunit [Candidatus Methanosuratincola sp.]